MADRYDKMLGALLGLALGDAIGMPVEGWSHSKIRERYGEITGFLPGPEDNEITRGFKAYETTDDTIITMLVAELILRSDGRPEPLLLVKKIEGWATENEKSKTVIGPSTRIAFEKIHKGIPVEEAGRAGITNGASMRIAPVGMFCDYHQGDALVSLVERLCLPTHNTSVAISAASAVAAAVSHGIYGDGGRDEMLDVSLSAAKSGRQYGFDVCKASVTAKIKLAVELSNSNTEDEDFLQGLNELVGTGLPSSESVPAALAIAYRTGRDLMKSIRLCANAGGDTDTMGAIAGAICGAHQGASLIPAEHAYALCDVNTFPFSQVAKEFAGRVK